MVDHCVISYSSYVLPPEIHAGCVRSIRETERLRREISEGRTEPLSDEALARIAALDRSIGMLPEPYREGVLRNTVDREPFGEEASESTWRRWKQRFLYTFAIDTGLY